jgi:hypothetical protein
MIKEHHQQWLALLLTVGEFTGATILVVQDGHFFALYLAFTYLMRETPGGKHYHKLVSAAVAKILPQRHDSQPVVSVDPYLYCLKTNPFERKP